MKISREKTAKIFPNAVCVCTAEERHVFGSFISREAAFRLMISMWHPLVPSEPEEAPIKVPDVEISECSIEDESSCSASGNEGGIKTSSEGLLIATALPLALPSKFSTGNSCEKKCRMFICERNDSNFVFLIRHNLANKPNAQKCVNGRY